MDSQATPGPVICEVCGIYFDSRRGLSSHARLHLRQLGVTASENSGAPIELLYQLIQERDGSLQDLKSQSSLPGSTPVKKDKTPAMEEETNASLPTDHRVLKTPRKMDHQGSSVPSSPSSLRPAEGSSSSFSENQTVTKPMWAPSDTDAPITLASDTSDEVHVCQLCGCWYETRKGLSSHARAHLRQIGIPDSDIKGSPIEFLYKMMEEEDFKPVSSEQQEELRANSSARGSSSKRPSDFSSPSASPANKRNKTPEDCTCVLCGEEFENRKGLASHARSHLRHIGMSELVGKSSAIETVQELVSSGMLEAVQPPKTSSAPGSPAARSLGPASSAVPAGSPVPGRPWTSSLSPNQLKGSQSPQSPSHRPPKAKKGFRLAVDPLLRKPKPEPVETEVSVQPKAPSTTGNSLIQKPTTAKPQNSETQSPPTVLCDFCGQLFETRKALSCHARAHLRQLGLTWSIRTSPIDLLKEVMLHGEERKESAHGGSSAPAKTPWTSQGSKRSRDSFPSGEASSNSCTSPVDYSMKEKSPSVKTGLSHVDATCEVCGFDFENRKALASHARAHLRQLGIFEWKADGATSPIELLSELIRKDPGKVTEITRRYRFGDLYVKKSQRSAAPPSVSTDSVPASNPKSVLMQHEQKVSRKDHGSISVRTARGIHPPKHGVSSGEGGRDAVSHQPSRSGSIPALLPKPPLTPLVKLVL
ncbi:protein Wiz-like isoform X2 [Cololabis saira]|uniref:protein Wiz-like isoform X2 n=1 Tax=Cololabis saira TaxID=129043 RepID=UPI002AD21190|nr:protein Wiz-like isoform X2 [Cololabis saira]